MLAAIRDQQLTDKRRIVVTGHGWEPIAGKHEAWALGPLDLSKCSRLWMRCRDGVLIEFVKIHGDTSRLTDQELDQLIARIPIAGIGAAL
jgi:hypothetical protein